MFDRLSAIVNHAKQIYADDYTDREETDYIVAELLDNCVTIPVYCKDCKRYDNTEGIQWCHMNSKFYPGGFDWHSFPEDGFCSYGERRTDEH